MRHWHGLQTLVVTATQGDVARSEGEVPFSVHRLPARPRLPHRQRMALLNLFGLREARRFRPDVVLSAHIVLAPAAWALTRSYGVPYVEYVYGSELANRPRLAAFALGRAAAVIAISGYTSSLAQRWTAPSRLHQIWPGVTPPPSPMNGHLRQPLIVTVARLTEPHKGHDVMLRALPLVREQVPDAEWVVIGDGPLRTAYERMAGELRLNNAIRILGEVSDEERDQWLQRARVFAMPSRLSATGGGEGFGIAYLEAGAHGLPVVAGNVGGASDAVIDGITGLLVDPTDPVAVATALTKLLSDAPLAHALGRAGEVRARGMAWPIVAQRVEDLLHRVAVGAR